MEQPIVHSIGIWFLLLSLFFPRLVLFFWWLTENLPYNTTPLLVDFFAAIFIPRVLILVYIYSIQGFSAWFWIHFVFLFWVFLCWGLRAIFSQSTG